MKIIIDISRLAIGFVFVFSGFVKAVDPSGTAIKFEEYFLAFGLDFLGPVALPLAVLLSTAEMLIGLNLLTKTWMAFSGWLLLIFMLFFTGLTFILALSNPVTDCGCFGDAIKLTNWETFWKNIILMVPAVIVFYYRNKMTWQQGIGKQWILLFVNMFIPVLISIYCILHEPIIDFRPYTIGTSIPDKMSIPESAPVDVFESILVYEKDGIKKEFNSTNFPWQDTTWKWVETRQILISKGYEPPIHDFLITNTENTDITEKLLADSNYVFLIIAPKLKTASEKGLLKLNNLAVKANNFGYPVYCLTSSTNQEISEFRNSFSPVYEICTADETTLKTIQRSNPGLMIIREGTILGKYNFRDAPSENELSTNVTSVIMEKYHSGREKLIFLLLFFAAVFIYSQVFSAGDFTKQQPRF